MSKPSRTARGRIAFGLSYVFLSIVGVTMLFPFFWMFLTSVKTPAEDVLNPAEWQPKIPWRLGKADIRNLPLFCRKLIARGESGSPCREQGIWRLVQERPRRTFLVVSRKNPRLIGRRRRIKASQMILESEKGIILAALNGALQQRDFYNERDFRGVTLSRQAQRLLKSIREDPLMLSTDNIRGWTGFIRKLAAAADELDTPGKRLWQALSDDEQKAIRRSLAEADKNDHENGQQRTLPVKRQTALIAMLNEAMRDTGLFRGADLTSLVIPTEAKSLLARVPGALSQLHVYRLNSLLMEAAFGRHVARDEYDGRVRRFNRLVLDASFPGDIVPTHRFHWENYRTVIIETRFARVLFNSIFVSVSVTFGLVFTSSLAAFAFARLNFIGRDKIFLSYLATMMIPGAVTMIPVFILIRQLGWANTYYALIIPGMFSAYGTFMLRQFFMSLPRDLEEAALLDGCSIWGIYRHVVVPLSKPALAALTILTFMGVWRGFMWPLIVTHTRDMYTLPVALAAFREMYGVRWTLMMAGSVIMIIPMLIVFILGQRYFIEGIKLGAIKG